MAENQELKAGYIIADRFEVRKRLGAGAFGVVYEAEHLIFRLPFRKVAVKVYNAGVVSEKNAAEKFNEIIQLSAIKENARQHQRKHLVEVYDAGVFYDESNAPRGYIVMELLKGQDLSSYIHHSRTNRPTNRSVKVALGIVKQLCDGLELAHNCKPAPIIHRDIKPANIILESLSMDLDDKEKPKSSFDRNAYIVDFGLAKDIHFLFKDTRSAGTISYQAPECFTKNKCSIETDIYSIGLVMYELLTFRHPFSWFNQRQAEDNNEEYARSQLEIRRKLAKAEHIEPFMDSSGIEKYTSLNKIVSQCLAFEARDRFSSVQELKKAIEAHESGIVCKNSTLKKVESTEESINRLWSEARFCMENMSSAGQGRKAEKKFNEALNLINHAGYQSKFSGLYLDMSKVLNYLYDSGLRSGDRNEEILSKAIQLARKYLMDNTDDRDGQQFFTELIEKKQQLQQSRTE